MINYIRSFIVKMGKHWVTFDPMAYVNQWNGESGEVECNGVFVSVCYLLLAFLVFMRDIVYVSQNHILSSVAIGGRYTLLLCCVSTSLSISPVCHAVFLHSHSLSPFMSKQNILIKCANGMCGHGKTKCECE